MAGILVNSAPEERVVRDRHENAAAPARRLVHLRQHFLVFLDVFEHVEGADHVEFIPERDPPRVHLKQLHAGQAPRGEAQPGGKYFAPG